VDGLAERVRRLVEMPPCRADVQVALQTARLGQQGVDPDAGEQGLDPDAVEGPVASVRTRLHSARVWGRAYMLLYGIPDASAGSRSRAGRTTWADPQVIRAHPIDLGDRYI
jgi:hypothetical protein